MATRIVAPCKIIIGGRVMAAAARCLAEVNEHLRAAALHLAATTDASIESIMHGIQFLMIQREAQDEAHAWSELECHRAAVLRAAANDEFSASDHLSVGPEDGRVTITSDLLNKWAEETRLHTTKLIGGEYQGAWTVDGIRGIHV